MVYDDKLADRMRNAIGEAANLTAKRMMGGVCFLIDGNMVSGAHREKTGEGLYMFRVGKENEAAQIIVDTLISADANAPIEFDPDDVKLTPESNGRPEDTR